MRTAAATTTTTAPAAATTAVVTAVVVPNKHQVKRSVHNVMHILFYTGTAVVLIVDGHIITKYQVLIQ